MSLLNLSHISNVTVWKIFLWPDLARAPKYRQLSELQDQLDRTAEVLGVKLPTVAMVSHLKNALTLGLRMRYPGDLTGGIQPFVLGCHASSQRKSASTASERYSMVVG